MAIERIIRTKQEISIQHKSSSLASQKTEKNKTFLVQITTNLIILKNATDDCTQKRETKNDHHL